MMKVAKKNAEVNPQKNKSGKSKNLKQKSHTMEENVETGIQMTLKQKKVNNKKKKSEITENEENTPSEINADFVSEFDQRTQQRNVIEARLRDFINPNLVKRQKEVKKNTNRVKKLLSAAKGCGAVVIKNIRHTVTLAQLGENLENYGSIVMLNLINSDKKESSNNKAYVFYSEPGVAQLVASKLHNDIFFCKVVKAFYIPDEALHTSMFMRKSSGLPKSINV